LKISGIAAIGSNGELGFENKLLWYIKEDFKNFKKLTLGHHLIMGRKTFQSIGKTLPGRTTIILTRDSSFVADQAITTNNMLEAIRNAREAGESELFICGGAEIYNLYLPVMDNLYLSKVNFSGVADTYFPEFDQSNWKLVKELSFTSVGNQPSWSFNHFQK
jgi:dihydrofolate reductase